jgi:hypothetical protein
MTPDRGYAECVSEHPRTTVDPDEPVVFVARRFDDPRLAEPSGWEASVFHAGVLRPVEEAVFSDIDEAIAWGRQRAEVVWVQLGGSWDTHYSAGSVHVHQWADGSGAPFPIWPPDNWPDYKGPEHEPRRYSPDDGVMGSSTSSETLRYELRADDDAIEA